MPGAGGRANRGRTQGIRNPAHAPATKGLDALAAHVSSRSENWSSSLDSCRSSLRVEQQYPKRLYPQPLWSQLLQCYQPKTSWQLEVTTSTQSMHKKRCLCVPYITKHVFQGDASCNLSRSHLLFKISEMKHCLHHFVRPCRVAKLVKRRLELQGSCIRAPKWVAIFSADKRISHAGWRVSFH